MANVRKISDTRDRSFSQRLIQPPDVDVKFDVREDEEQNVKLQQCIDLLVAAGYFRARIKGLSPFDKIVGGMTWCITSCNVDIDIDLLFQENSTIGQKINLTERIVRILPKMKCPHRVEPHQIQGLDFVNIYPVMQWLVKRAIETRAEMGDYIRAFSVSQFNKYHSIPQEEAKIAIKNKALSSLKTVKATYQPQRRFRHQDPLSIKGEENRVQTTLLEYGRQYGYNQGRQQGVDEKNEGQGITQGKPSANRSAEMSDIDAQADEEKRIKSLMSGLSQMPGKQMKLMANTVGTIVGMHSEEIQQLTSHSFHKPSDVTEGDKLGAANQQKRIIASLEKQIEQTTQKVEQLKGEHSTLKQSYKEVYDVLKQVRAETGQLDNELAEIADIEARDDTGALKTLQKLVALNETLKKQEQQFKATCKEEMVRLKDMIKQLEEEGGGVMSEEEKERLAALQQQHGIDAEKLQKIRLLLARKNREISTLNRKIDDVPTRAELTQYQRRFVELYNQVATKHTEAKQFYALYNTLLDKKSYLAKEVNLLNSVYDNFTKGMATPASKEQYLRQFELIVEGIVQNKSTAEKGKQKKKVQRDQLNDEYLSLVDQQRLYFKTVNDFQQECNKNEVLQSKLREQ